MCYPVCGMMHVNEPLLLIGKSSPCGGSMFPLSDIPSKNVLNVLLNNYEKHTLVLYTCIHNFWDTIQPVIIRLVNEHELKFPDLLKKKFNDTFNTFLLLFLLASCYFYMKNLSGSLTVE